MHLPRAYPQVHIRGPWWDRRCHESVDPHENISAFDLRARAEMKWVLDASHHVTLCGMCDVPQGCDPSPDVSRGQHHALDIPSLHNYGPNKCLSKLLDTDFGRCRS